VQTQRAWHLQAECHLHTANAWDSLVAETTAWTHDRNTEHTTIDWRARTSSRASASEDWSNRGASRNALSARPCSLTRAHAGVDREQFGPGAVVDGPLARVFGHAQSVGDIPAQILDELARQPVMAAIKAPIGSHGG
jgi:hypothetical protein